MQRVRAPVAATARAATVAAVVDTHRGCRGVTGRPAGVAGGVGGSGERQIVYCTVLLWGRRPGLIVESHAASEGVRGPRGEPPPRAQGSVARDESPCRCWCQQRRCCPAAGHTMQRSPGWPAALRGQSQGAKVGSRFPCGCVWLSSSAFLLLVLGVGIEGGVRKRAARRRGLAPSLRYPSGGWHTGIAKLWSPACVWWIGTAR